MRVSSFRLKVSGFRLVLLLVTVVVLAGVAWAQGPEQHDVSWHVVGAGGQDSASAAHQVRGTLGQLAIGPAAAAGGHPAPLRFGGYSRVGSGYWYGTGRTAGVWRVYLPVVVKNRGQ